MEELMETNPQYTPTHEKPMFTDTPGAKETGRVLSAVNITFGAVLILIGLGMGIWVFYHIFAFVKDPQHFDNFRNLITGPVTVDAPAEGGRYTIQAPLEFLGYIILVMAMMILVTISCVFINGGAKLLNGDMQKLFARFDRFRDRVEDKLDRMKS